MPAEGSATPQSETSALVSQLRQSLGLLRVAFDATGEAMLIVDSERQVRWVNQTAAELWGGAVFLCA
ncbi:PAS domain-containing protein [Synechococcus sp. W2B2]|uniref:PAS domain-containing protein n=1 Tax=Synechococcus sp. W2B2 TaxID=3392296 RepID=UPI0039ED98C6